MRVTVFIVALLGRFLAGSAVADSAVTQPAASQPSEIIRIDASRLIDADLVVEPGQKLVIAAGVTLKFAPGVGIIGRSVVEARGTATQPVRFVPADPAKGWKNVSLIGPPAAASVFEHCEFSGGRGCPARFDPKMRLVGFGQAMGGKVLVCGGALFVYSANGVSVRHCRFEGNASHWAGAIMFWGKAGGSVADCVFVRNQADEKEGDAGALQCAFVSSPTIERCAFVGNSARYGGALHCLSGSSPRVISCYFQGNRSGASGAAVSCFNNCVPVFSTCFISGNRTEAKQGGGIASVAHSKPVLKGCYLGENVDASGSSRGLWANDEIRGQKDTSSFDEPTVGTQADVVKLLNEQGVMDRVPPPPASQPAGRMLKSNLGGSQ